MKLVQLIVSFYNKESNSARELRFRTQTPKHRKLIKNRTFDAVLMPIPYKNRKKNVRQNGFKPERIFSDSLPV